MKHKQQGFIILMMFVMLTVCATMVSLFLVRGTVYRCTVKSFLSRKRLERQLESALAVVEKSLVVESQDSQSTPDQGDAQAQTSQQASSSDDSKKLLAAFLQNRFKKVSATMMGQTDGQTVMSSVVLESGKINLNSLYDFSKKKFVNEGQDSGDKKQFAQWLFGRIAEVRGGKSLFGPFAEFLEKRSTSLNSVTELLQISEFAEYFYDAVFYQASESQDQPMKLCLTDLFTVASETDTIQPWVLSPSLIVLLGGSVGSLDPKIAEQALQKFAAEMDWSAKWNDTVGVLYGIKFDNLPEEVKSILTSQFEANIFSISLSVHDQNHKAGLYALLKQNKDEKGLSTYDIVRMYQI